MNALKKYNLAFTAYETSATSSFSNSKIMYLCNFIMLQTKSVGNMILSFLCANENSPKATADCKGRVGGCERSPVFFARLYQKNVSVLVSFGLFS